MSHKKLSAAEKRASKLADEVLAEFVAAMAAVPGHHVRDDGSPFVDRSDLAILSRVDGETHNVDGNNLSHIFVDAGKLLQKSLEDRNPPPGRGMAYDARHIIQDVLGTLRAVQWCHQTSHWQVKGDTSYGDHLMLQRIYETLDSEVDAVAEKIVAQFGADTVKPSGQALLATKLLVEWSKINCPLKRSYNAEQQLLQVLESALDGLENWNRLSVGMDNLLRTIYDAHETHLYLLQQRLQVIPRHPGTGSKLAGKAMMRLGAMVVTDTASILAISPEQLSHVIENGAWQEAWLRGDSKWADDLIREKGGAVFHTGADGLWDVQVPGGVREFGEALTGKTAGWWPVQDKEAGDYNGDGPADVMGKALDQIDLMYRQAWRRGFHPREIQAVFEFCAKPVMDGSWPINEWVGTVAQRQGMSQDAVVSADWDALMKMRQADIQLRNGIFASAEDPHTPSSSDWTRFDETCRRALQTSKEASPELRLWQKKMSKVAGLLVPPPVMVQEITKWVRQRICEKVLSDNEGGLESESAEDFLKRVQKLKEGETVKATWGLERVEVSKVDSDTYALRSPRMKLPKAKLDLVTNMVETLAGMGGSDEDLVKEAQKYASKGVDHDTYVDGKVPLNLQGWPYLKGPVGIVDAVNKSRQDFNRMIDEAVKLVRSSKAKGITWSLRPPTQAFPGVIVLRDELRWEIEKQHGEMPMEWDDATGLKVTRELNLSKYKLPLLKLDEVNKAMEIEGWKDIRLDLMFRRSFERGQWDGRVKRMTLTVSPSDLKEASDLRAVLRDIEDTVTHECIHLAQDLLSALKGTYGAGQPSRKTKLDVGFDIEEYSQGGDSYLTNDKEFYAWLSDEVRAFRKKNPYGGDIKRWIRFSDFFRALERNNKPRWQKAIKVFTTEVSQGRRASKKEKPLTPREEADLRKANIWVMDWEMDGGTLPKEIEKITSIPRRLTPSEARVLLEWFYVTAPGAYS